MKMQCVVLPNVAIFWFQSAVHRECVHECLFRDGIALYAELTGLKLDGLPKQHSMLPCLLSLGNHSQMCTQNHRIDLAVMRTAVSVGLFWVKVHERVSFLSYRNSVQYSRSLRQRKEAAQEVEVSVCVML